MFAYKKAKMLTCWIILETMKALCWSKTLDRISRPDRTLSTSLFEKTKTLRWTTYWSFFVKPRLSLCFDPSIGKRLLYIVVQWTKEYEQPYKYVCFSLNSSLFSVAYLNIWMGNMCHCDQNKSWVEEAGSPAGWGGVGGGVCQYSDIHRYKRKALYVKCMDNRVCVCGIYASPDVLVSGAHPFRRLQEATSVLLRWGREEAPCLTASRSNA